MNIIYEVDKDSLRFIAFNPNSSYRLEELKFYVPRKSNITPFLLIRDKSEEYTVIKLSLMSKDNNYFMYMVAPDASISVENGRSVISLIGIADNSFVFSNSYPISLNFDNYQLGNQLYLIEDLSKNLILTYKQIEELTKINIEIYQEIQKEVSK